MCQHFLRLPLAHDVRKRYFASSVGFFRISVVDIDIHHAGLQIVCQVSVFVNVASLYGVDIDFVFQTMVKDLLDGSLVLVEVFDLSLMHQVIFCSVFDFFFTEISFFK
jgi:acetoin utilization deacetylase AcuC-like enzyme